MDAVKTQAECLSPARPPTAVFLQEVKQMNGKLLPKPCEMFQSLKPAVSTRVSALLGGVKRHLTLSRSGDHSCFILLLAFGQEEPWLKVTDELDIFSP